MADQPTSNWAEELASKLAAHDSMFIDLEAVRTGRSKLNSEEEEALGARSDGADIPHQYARIITRLLEALQQLPEFADGRGLRALKALQFDLHALDEGNKAQRLTPVPRDRRPGTPAGRRVYQAHVILCVRLLEELGFSSSVARAEVATIFSKHGHRGQQGEDLSPETLTRWREAVLAPDGPYLPGRRMVERELTKWRESDEWPCSIEQARAYIERKASEPRISLAASK